MLVRRDLDRAIDARSAGLNDDDQIMAEFHGSWVVVGDFMVTGGRSSENVAAGTPAVTPSVDWDPQSNTLEWSDSIVMDVRSFRGSTSFA